MNNPTFCAPNLTWGEGVWKARVVLVFFFLIEGGKEGHWPNVGTYVLGPSLAKYQAQEKQLGQCGSYLAFTIVETH